MLYNKNIILNILNNTFSDEIEAFVQKCVLEMDEEELETFFEQEVDYAFFDEIEQIVIVDFEIESENDTEKSISGTLEISANIDGYIHWDDEAIYVGSTIITLGLLYDFQIQGKRYVDLYLEYLY